MDTLENSLTGKVKDQWELEYIQEHVDIFKTQDICIGTTKVGIDLPAGQHTHSSYEFIIPLSHSFLAKSDNQTYLLEKSKIFPFNSEQNHGPAYALTKHNFISITIEKNYLHEIAHQISDRQDIMFENTGFKLSGETKILMHSFIEECKSKQLGHDLAIESLSRLLTIGIIRQTKNNISEPPLKYKSYGNRSIKRVIEFMREEYNAGYSLEELAQTANLSTYHFIRVFKHHTGKTPYEYLLDVRIEKAKEILSTGIESITEICFLCGYNNPSHFTAVFRKKVGVTPSEFRRLLSGS